MHPFRSSFEITLSLSLALFNFQCDTVIEISDDVVNKLLPLEIASLYRWIRFDLFFSVCPPNWTTASSGGSLKLINDHCIGPLSCSIISVCLCGESISLAIYMVCQTFSIFIGRFAVKTISSVVLALSRLVQEEWRTRILWKTAAAATVAAAATAQCGHPKKWFQINLAMPTECMGEVHQLTALAPVPRKIPEHGAQPSVCECELVERSRV